MKKVAMKVMRALIAVIPVMAMLAVTVSANTIASPFNGQPTPPNTLKNHRKF